MLGYHWLKKIAFNPRYNTFYTNHTFLTMCIVRTYISSTTKLQLFSTMTQFQLPPLCVFCIPIITHDKNSIIPTMCDAQKATIE